MEDEVKIEARRQESAEKEIGSSGCSLLFLNV
jgi:hypothetical protein